MAAKRRSRCTVKPLENNNFCSLKLKDVLCPICRSILIEPVTLPCNHGFCLTCFNDTMANTNLVCPLCRIRVSSWLRVANKEKKLVNIKLWKFIKETFPEQVNNKLNDIDENLEEVVNTVRLASPGALRREYEEQKYKEEVELQKQQKAEFEASKKLIEKLKHEEKQLQEIEEKTIKSDEEIAKKLSLDINSSNVASSSKRNLPKKQNCIDKFITRIEAQTLLKEKCFIKEYKSKILCQDKNLSINNSFNVDKINNVQKPVQYVNVRKNNNSIESECCYFKSIDHRNVPPSEGVRIIKIPTKLACASTVIIGAPKGEILFKHYTHSPFIGLEMASNCKYYKQKISCNNTCIPQINLGMSRQLIVGTKRKYTNVNKKTKKIKTKSPSDLKDTYNCERNSKCVNSPLLFHGFNRKEIDTAVPSIGLKLNGCLNEKPFEQIKELIPNETEDLLQKKIQEREDFEIAKKLQDELNQNGCRYYMRNESNTTTQKRKNNCKQLTLDHMITTQVLK